MILNRSSFRFFSILLLPFLLFPNYSYSQSNTIIEKKWSIGLYGGLIFPNELAPIDKSNTISIDLSYKINSRWSLLLGEKYNFIKNDEYTDYESGSLKREKAFFYELFIGCRYYLNNSSPFYFGTVSLEYYNINRQIIDEYWEVNNVNLSNIGIQCGIGTDISVFKNISISSKIGYSYLIINHPFYNSITYFEFQAGIKYNF